MPAVAFILVYVRINLKFVGFILTVGVLMAITSSLGIDLSTLFSRLVRL